MATRKRRNGEVRELLKNAPINGRPLQLKGNYRTNQSVVWVAAKKLGFKIRTGKSLKNPMLTLVWRTA